MSGIFDIIKSYPRTFWIANTIELFERWAWYGFYMLFANYLTGSFDKGGLEFSQNQKSIIMSVGTGILYFLPVITGAIADHYGYRKMLFFSFLLYISAFVLFPFFDTFNAVFAMYIYLAIGGAMFKPIISATIAKTTNDHNASIGFGIFYMMVNIGSFLGPLFSLVAQEKSSSAVFYLSAGLIALNFLMLLFYKEPEREKSEGSLSDAILNVCTRIITVFRDWRFVIFLCIIAIFWAMYFQLFYTLPVFIMQWVDSSAIYDLFSNNAFIMEYYTEGNQMKPEFITNLDAMFIVMFQILVSFLVMRLKPLNAMMTGVIVNAIGLSLTFITQNVFFVIAAMLIFGLGEMAASPKVTEYIGRIAPKDKKALYMGFSFVPLFIGSMLAGILSGPVYQAQSDLTTITKNYAKEKSFNVSEDLSQDKFLEEVARQDNKSVTELKAYFWQTNKPSRFWYTTLASGVLAMLLLFAYDRLLLKEHHK